MKRYVMSYQALQVEKIGIVDLFKLKSTGGRYYIVVPRHLIDSYNLRVADLLKIQIREVRRTKKGSGKEVDEAVREN